MLERLHIVFPGLLFRNFFQSRFHNTGSHVRDTRQCGKTLPRSIQFRLHIQIRLFGLSCLDPNIHQIQTRRVLIIEADLDPFRKFRVIFADLAQMDQFILDRKVLINSHTHIRQNTEFRDFQLLPDRFDLLAHVRLRMVELTAAKDLLREFQNLIAARGIFIEFFPFISDLRIRAKSRLLPAAIQRTDLLLVCLDRRVICESHFIQRRKRKRPSALYIRHQCIRRNCRRSTGGTDLSPNR